ncbi:ubiquinone biosynthesis accessory factor UbiJ [Marinicella gelatinilytica]|uniref:ubiquinone biosynthesis accessory factor UbiJ n=1 Tax=Marinicella gelatinilytica TaxID=2996017 RepID=UPI002260F4E0|nr:SCP2 sterol-binding domain-containing protein [Marinicella gelatinilytica]MCX7546035.1 SCP2 sterol-binding domain-containing protein [Marinicella gelatinilytica]
MMSPTVFVLDKAINRAIQYDKTALKKLKPHIGKRVAINIQPIGPRIHLHITETGIEVTGEQDTAAADTTISGKPSGLFAMASSQHIAGLDQVVINGDAGLGQFIADFLKNLNPDNEEALCDVFGEIPGYHISQTLQKIHQQGQQFGESLKRNVHDFLVHEDRSLIAPTEMQQFLDDVDDLQADVVRIERQIKQLLSNHS